MADRPDVLTVTRDGIAIAELVETAAMRIGCRYLPDALDQWPLNTPVISCSLPLSEQIQEATAWVEGLLPEGEARAILAGRFRVASYDAWMLLAHLGRDIAGALQVHVPDTQLDRPERVDPYTPTELVDAVIDLPRHPLDIRDDSELSLAGVQNKMTMVKLEESGWGRPVGGYPSTHILKVEDRRYPGLATLEAASLRLAAATGLTTVEAHVEEIGGLPCMIVSRYDRTVVDGQVVRVHQEDLCQAVGQSAAAARGRAKYERYGGPGLLAMAGLLRQWGPPGEREQLARAMVYTVLIGNADAHAKNLSLLHPEPGQIALAPLYDTVPTALFDRLPRRCAMMINGVFEDLAAVTFDDLVAEMSGRRRWGLPVDTAAQLVEQTCRDVAAAVGKVDAPDQLIEYVHRRTQDLLR